MSRWCFRSVTVALVLLKYSSLAINTDMSTPPITYTNPELSHESLCTCTLPHPQKLTSILSPSEKIFSGWGIYCSRERTCCCSLERSYCWKEVLIDMTTFWTDFVQSVVYDHSAFCVNKRLPPKPCHPHTHAHTTVCCIVRALRQQRTHTLVDN